MQYKRMALFFKMLRDYQPQAFGSAGYEDAHRPKVLELTKL